MAKKNLTPEEFKAKLERKQANNKMFFGTFAKALAVFLALVVAWSLVSIAFTLPSLVGGTGGAASAGAQTSNEDLNKKDQAVDLGGEQLGEGEATEDGVTKENIHEKFNEWTATAAKGNYKFTRVSAYTPSGAIDVGNATGTLNKIIQAIDSNSSLDTVVGGFLGIGNREGEVQNGQIPEGMNPQYALKAMQLTAEDIKGASVDGNTYKIQLNACANPKKDNSNALSRATNDFFTHEEVVNGIADFTTAIKVESTNVEYTKIVITATVLDGKLTNLEISYTFAATMNLKAVVSIEGKGEATNVISYTFA